MNGDYYERGRIYIFGPFSMTFNRRFRVWWPHDWYLLLRSLRDR